MPQDAARMGLGLILFIIGFFFLAFWGLAGIFIMDWLLGDWWGAFYHKYLYREKLPKIKRPGKFKFKKKTK